MKLSCLYIIHRQSQCNPERFRSFCRQISQSRQNSRKCKLQKKSLIEKIDIYINNVYVPNHRHPNRRDRWLIVSPKDTGNVNERDLKQWPLDSQSRALTTELQPLQRPICAKLTCRGQFSSFSPNHIRFESFSNNEHKNEGIISEAKHSRTTANFGKALFSLSQSAD